MVKGTPVHEHVLKMISYSNELEALGSQVDLETKVDSILASLSEDFDGFIMSFNMNRIAVSSSELINMLQGAEDLFTKKGSVEPNVMMGEKTCASSFKSNIGKNNGKQSGSKFQRALGVKRDIDKNKGKGKGKGKGNGSCFYCGKPGHWKRNCRHYLVTVKKDKPVRSVY